MKWNSKLYDEKHNYVAEYGKKLIDLVNFNKDQVILDLGCGTGVLSNELARKGAKVLGVDLSSDMIKKAKESYPKISFGILNACELNFDSKFDTVFSNAVFHWIPDQRRLLKSINKALKKNGKLICEFGSEGNIKVIEDAFKHTVEKLDIEYKTPFFFPSKEDYTELLISEGFEVEYILEYSRPTKLNEEEKGLRNWISQFFSSYLVDMREEEKENIFVEVEDLCRNKLWIDNSWVADYRRLQVVAIKK